MAEALLAPVLQKLAGLISKEVEVFCCAKDELQILKRELEKIKEVMTCADGVPYFEVKGVKNWLQEFKDVTYDAEDIIDEYQAKIKKTNHMVSKRGKVCIPLISCKILFDKHTRLRYKLGRDIEAIKDRLDKIAKEGERYKLLEMFPSRNRTMATNRAINCVITEKDTISRKSDMEDLIEKLVGENKKMGIDGSKLPIISIQGIGGIGKTTLAKMVFNDDRIEKHFGESKLWSSIGQRPNAQEVIKKLLEQVKKDVVNVSDINTVTKLLDPIISNHKFLFVLDDIWDLDWWEDVKPLLMKGAIGSRIVITTRTKDISNKIRATYVHELKQFTNEQSWELFLKHALMEGETENDLDRRNLKDVGRVIVEKCGGLPLVVQTIGKVMQLKERKREDWESMAKRKIWDRSVPSSLSETSFLPGIILSYDDLPSHLKRYFAHTCVFPKGSNWGKRDLIMHFMAHGHDGNADEEDFEVVARGHINDLIGRSMIQVYDDPEKSPDVYLYMHDIIHDLATEIAGKEYNHSYAHKNTRHLTVNEFYNSPHETGLENNNVLRTLIWVGASHDITLDKYFNNLRRLRVLDLSLGNFTKLPDSVGNLLLLKHLDLTSTKIKELPASIAKLQDLLSLFLDGSEVKELRKEIGQLRKLRHLSLENMPQLEFVAEGLGELTCLRTLSRFIISCTNGNNVGCNIKELKKLSKLSGKLTIENLERVIQIVDAREALLQEKQHLESLELAFGKIMIHEGASQEEERRIAEDQEHLLRHLQLPPNLKSLALTKYCGKKLPEYWFDGRIHLETLKLLDCSWIQVLPSFSLKGLCLYGCRDVRVLPLSPELESIELANLDNWDGFGKGVGECLKSLKASNCPKLKKLPHFPTLQRLEINSCEQLNALQEEEEAEFGLDMPAIIELVIRGCRALLVLPSMPILKTMKIMKCQNWEGWSSEKENDAMVPCLRDLEIWDCPGLGTLPCFPDLIRLQIYGCRKLHAPWRKEDELPIGLEILHIRECPNISFQVNWLLPLSKLQSLTIEWSLLGAQVTASHISALQRLQSLSIYCMPGQNPLPEWLWQLSGLVELSLGVEEAASLLGSWQNLKQLRFLGILISPELITLDQPTDQQNYPSNLTHFCSTPKLESLLVERCPKLKLLPDEFQHLVHLNSLFLVNLPELESLPQSLTSLPNLVRMEIVECPKLKSLPDGLYHLKVLSLRDLPELESLSQSVTTLPKLEWMWIEDCPKLASLPAGLEGRLGRGLEVSGNCPATLLQGGGGGT